MNKRYLVTAILLTTVFTKSALLAANYSLSVKKEKLEEADTLKINRLGKRDVEHDQKKMCLAMNLKSLTTRDEGELKLQWVAVKQSLRNAYEVVVEGSTLVSLTFNKPLVIRSEGFDLQAVAVNLHKRNDIKREEEVSAYAARLVNAEGEVLAFEYNPSKSKEVLKKLLDEATKAEEAGVDGINKKPFKNERALGPKRAIKPRKK